MAVGAVPTTEEFEALPEATRRYIMALEQQTVPSSAVRDAIVWKETAIALAVRVRELEAELASSRPGVAQAVPRAAPDAPTLDRAAESER